ncbi:MAG: NusG domain II-containing protein [Christensenellales bacterium]
MRVFKWFDVIVLAVFLVAVVLSICFLVKPAGEFVEIYKNGELVMSGNLSSDFVYKVDSHTTVTVSDKKAYVSYSDCTGQDCVMAGKISKAGEMITCLPNKVVVKITGKGEVDVVTG